MRAVSAELVSIPGQIPSPFALPPGCRFADRCPERFDRCAAAPPLHAITAEHSARCWLSGRNMAEPLVELRNVSKTFQTGRFVGRSGVRAVDGVSLTLLPNETLGIVGESGSGKSTLTRLILRLIRPTSGNVLFAGHDIGLLARNEMRGLRRQMQAVFQDPAASFNPRQKVLQAMLAPLEVHRVDRARHRDLAAEALDLVGLNVSFFDRYPHQLSGGQRQRVSIARAIVLRPALIVADEPTSALDVSVQAQILQPVQVDEARTRSELHLCQPQPRCDPLRERSRRRHVQRAYCGNGTC